MKQAHLSIDDCTKCFKELKENQYKSIFEVSLFKILQELNSLYDAKFTLYCWSVKSKFKISSLDDSYKKEFEENTEWLKIGFHSSAEFNYLEQSHLGRTELEFYNTVSDFNNTIIKIAGKRSLTDKIRLHYYSATHNEIEFLKNNGIKELLTSHDGRRSYMLTEMQQNYIDCNGYLKEKNMSYVKSDLCIDNIEDIGYINKLIERQRITLFSHEVYFQRDLLKWKKILKLLINKEFEFIV